MRGAEGHLGGTASGLGEYLDNDSNRIMSVFLSSHIVQNDDRAIPEGFPSFVLVFEQIMAHNENNTLLCDTRKSAWLISLVLLVLGILGSLKIMLYDPIG